MTASRTAFASYTRAPTSSLPPRASSHWRMLPLSAYSMARYSRPSGVSPTCMVRVC